MNRASLSICATRRTRSSSLGTLSSALSPRRDSLAVFSLTGALPSAASATPPKALFDSFTGTTGPSDFPRSSITGLRPQPSPHDPPLHHSRRVTVGPPGSQHEELRTCRVLRPRRVPRQLAITLSTTWPSATGESVGTPNCAVSRFNSPACTTPTDASPPPSRAADARLRAIVCRYSLRRRAIRISFFMPVYPALSASCAPVSTRPERFRTGWSGSIVALLSENGSTMRRWLRFPS